jgi:hypothetical protein
MFEPGMISWDAKMDNQTVLSPDYRYAAARRTSLFGGKEPLILSTNGAREASDEGPFLRALQIF